MVCFVMAGLFLTSSLRPGRSPTGDRLHQSSRGADLDEMGRIHPTRQSEKHLAPALTPGQYIWITAGRGTVEGLGGRGPAGQTRESLATAPTVFTKMFTVQIEAESDEWRIKCQHTVSCKHGTLSLC